MSADAPLRKDGEKEAEEVGIDGSSREATLAVEVVELLSAVLQYSPSNRTGMLQINGVCRPNALQQGPGTGADTRLPEHATVLLPFSSGCIGARQCAMQRVHASCNMTAHTAHHAQALQGAMLGIL